MEVNENIIAERIVISGLMNKPDLVQTLTDLEPEHFYSKTHKILYFLIKQMYKDFKGDTIDSLSILSTAKNENIEFEKEIERSGGLEYLETLKELGEDYQEENIEKQAEIVTKMSFFRDMKQQLESQVEYLENGSSKSRNDVIDNTRSNIDKVIAKYTISDKYKKVGDVFEEIMEKAQEDVKDGKVGIPSKIEYLNRFFTYRKGELSLISARAKQGKSAFAINEAHNIAVVNNIPLLYLDTEMSTKTFLMRLISIDSNIPMQDIESFKFRTNKEQLERYKKSEERIKKAPLIHKYSTNWTPSKVRNDVISLVRKEGIQMLVYDYLKVKEVNESKSKEHNQLGNWTIALKDLAGELNIPILTLAQMSPYETRVADSDKINRYASVVSFLLPLPESEKTRLKQWGYPNTKDYIFVKYNRNGACMEDDKKGVYLDFDRDCVTFLESKYQEKYEDLAL